MDELEKIRKKVKKELEESIDINEDSDIPIREKLVKEKKLKKIRDS